MRFRERIDFTIWGVPQSWQRVKRAAQGHAYMPKQTRDFQNRIKDRIQENWPEDLSPHNDPALLQLTAFFPVPISWPKWKLDAFNIDPSLFPFITTPDSDNVAKNIMDAADKLLIENDARVCDLLIRKRYSLKPRIEVTWWLFHSTTKEEVAELAGQAPAEAAPKERTQLDLWAD